MIILRFKKFLTLLLAAAIAPLGTGTATATPPDDLTITIFASSNKPPEIPLGIKKADADRILTSSGAVELSSEGSANSHRYDGSKLPFVNGSSRKAENAIPNTFENCRANPGGTATLYGLVIDRHTFCRHGYLVARATNSSDTEVGSLLYRETHTGAGINGTREALVSIQLDDFRPVGVFSYASLVAISLKTSSEQDVNPNDPSAPKACTAAGAGGAIQDPVFGWKARSSVSWSILSDPALGAEDERKVDCHWKFTHQVRVNDPANAFPWTSEFGRPAQDLRFDSAGYLTKKDGSVFTRAVPYLEYSRTDPRVKSVAEHIYTAFNNPSSTLPAKSDGSPKVIPGNISGTPPTLVTRLFPGANPIAQRSYDDNRLEVAKACAGIPHNPDEQCDEFPFASTWEGAAMPGGNFSVRYVDGTENGAAGTALATWLGSDRILHNEKYGVDIIP
ncbi:NucA/NucB deoxyribonuclease domain-containing protein [Streptomyces sp. BE20]|uniref:NucA/NucB deoxyribonuclease domain-containing protein n=1 Tax=Streptomyces sp. BE20 TaxID=3002525 RepID=UPI002E77C441|nr:NucA/NucB deoxyribonuclease domain-containing protein [Streptomyces sp. BE20]MEE1823249.1 NucA/NucB deoxyribonuclease domain-containing protein [Streptomyces sp. BE20]